MSDEKQQDRRLRQRLSTAINEVRRLVSSTRRWHYCHNNVSTGWHFASAVFILCFVAFAFATTCWWIQIYILWTISVVCGAS